MYFLYYLPKLVLISLLKGWSETLSPIPDRPCMLLKQIGNCEIREKTKTSAGKSFSSAKQHIFDTDSSWLLQDRLRAVEPYQRPKKNNFPVKLWDLRSKTCNTKYITACLLWWYLCYWQRPQTCFLQHFTLKIQTLILFFLHFCSLLSLGGKSIQFSSRKIKSQLL